MHTHQTCIKYSTYFMIETTDENDAHIVLIGTSVRNDILCTASNATKHLRSIINKLDVITNKHQQNKLMHSTKMYISK